MAGIGTEADRQPLARKRALVTGGSGGLGTAISTALAQAGAAVAVGYRTNEAGAAALCAALAADGAHAVPVQIDIADPLSIEQGVAAAADALGGLDIVVNNAATTRRPEGTGLAAITPDYWDEMMETNVRGPLLVARAAEPLLRAAAPGHIVNIGSTIGEGAFGSGYPFSVSKAAVAPLTRYLATTLAPDVLVNCVAPGLMEGTGLTKNASQEVIDWWKGAAATRGTTSIPDVARQVVTCCSSTSMTGCIVVIDGGVHFG